MNALGEELLISSVGADFRQSQHDVHLLLSTIVHVKPQNEMGDTHSQCRFCHKLRGNLE